jgi:hypothetical protein
MARKMKRLETLFGFLYGSVLLVLGAQIAGFGHGLYALLGLISAPFSLFGIRAALMAPPLFWAGVGFAADPRRTTRRYALFLLVTHYCSAAFVLLRRNGPFADFEYWEQLPRSIKILSAITLSIYIIGQVAVWGRIATARNRVSTTR